MDDSLQTEQADTAEVIREICQHAAPDEIWDALEAKGIETTPGVVFQALQHAADPQPKTPEEGSGLTADDLATLGNLAVKAGGVEQLIRILGVWHDVPK